MARQGFRSEHWQDAEGRPAGGVAFGTGFAISWQHGPLGACSCDDPAAPVHDFGCERREPNGAFVEDVAGAVVDRLREYQRGEFADGYNRQAIDAFETGLQFLRERTRAREAAGVEGTHELTPAAG